MENNILSLTPDVLPQLIDCNILTASDDFFHMDRTADFNVLIYVTDGVMYVSENGTDYSISSGELLFLKKGIRHFGRRPTQRGTRWFYAHFQLNDTVTEKSVGIPKKISGLSESTLEEKMLELCEYFHGNDEMKAFRQDLMLCEFLIGLCSKDAPSRKSLADRICDFLDKQTSSQFTRELLESKFFLSYSYMAAEFKKEKGLSMGQYHNNVKMKKACALLRSTLLPVGTVAEELGFSDMLYFSKKFHAHAGVSPTDYRKKAQMEY